MALAWLRRPRWERKKREAVGVPQTYRIGTCAVSGRGCMAINLPGGALKKGQGKALQRRAGAREQLGEPGAREGAGKGAELGQAHEAGKDGVVC